MVFPFSRHVGFCMIVALTLSLFPQGAEGGFIPSGVTGTQSDNGVTDVTELQRQIERRKVKGTLRDLGFTDSEADERLSWLNADQIHELSVHIDDVRVGAGWEWIGIIYLAVIGVIIIYNLFFSKGRNAAPAS